MMLEDVLGDPRAIAVVEAMRAQTAVTPTDTTC
jgi:hypothetical protein